MARYACIISLLLFFLALSMTQGQEEYGLARVAAENLEPVSPLPSRRPRTYRYAKPARRDERAVRNPVDKAFAAQLSAIRAQLIEQIYHVVDDTSRTYRYLKAAIEYERAVGNDATTMAYVIQLQQTMSKRAGSATRHARSGSPGTRTDEIEVIAAMADLRYEDVAYLALGLEAKVRQGERLRSSISKLFSDYTLEYTLQHPWGHLLVGFWPEKLGLGLAWIFWGCVYKIGTGRCWPAVGYTMILLLVGPTCALLHTFFLALKGRWSLFSF